MVIFLNYNYVDDEDYIRVLTMNDKKNVDFKMHKIYIVELTKVKFCDKKNN